MREMSAIELETVCGGIDGYVSPMEWEGVSQWEWDELVRMLEEQNKRASGQQR